MKADFSRLTFDRRKHFSGVRMQQGRVQLDADWNEQLDLNMYRLESEVRDFIGRSGAPALPSGESDDFRMFSDAGQLYVGPGRYYVQGKLFENEQTAILDEQPDLPGYSLPEEQGFYLAYLDAWQRLITPLEDESLLEPALGGADTAVRVKNVWQVRLSFLGSKQPGEPSQSPAGIPSGHDSWTLAALGEEPDSAPISSGQMKARMAAAAALENSLYRVEIHKPGGIDQATFKWSRDNASVAARVNAIDGNTLTISSAGRDAQVGFAPGQWIELANEQQTLNGEPGQLAQLTSVQGSQLVVAGWPDEPPLFDSAAGFLVRRWDSKGYTPGDSTAEQGDWPLGSAEWVELERGIQVQFAGDETYYKSGDYWLIPARHNLQDGIFWPGANFQPPHGVQHEYVALALVQYLNPADGWEVVQDLRRTFKSLTTGLLSKAGDNVNGTLGIDGDLSVKGHSLLQGLLEVSGATRLRGALDVNGRATLHGPLSVRDSLGLGTAKPAEKLHIYGGAALIEALGAPTVQQVILPGVDNASLSKSGGGGGYVWALFAYESWLTLCIYRPLDEEQGGTAEIAGLPIAFEKIVQTQFGGIQDLAFAGDLAAVIPVIEDRPDNILEIRSLTQEFSTLASYAAENSQINSCAISGEYLLIARVEEGTESGYLEIIDLREVQTAQAERSSAIQADPLILNPVGSCRLEEQTDFIRDILICGRYACIWSNDRTLEIIDISDLQAPQPAGIYTATTDEQDYINAITSDDERVYVATEAEIQTFLPQKPESAQSRQPFVFGTGSDIFGSVHLQVYGNYLIISYVNHLAFMDLDPAAHAEIKPGPDLPPGTAPDDFIVVDKETYLALRYPFNGDENVHLLQLLDPQTRIGVRRSYFLGNMAIGSQYPGESRLKVNGDVRIDGGLTVHGQIRDQSGPVMPVGVILSYAGSTAPEGWLLCDGKKVEKHDYPDLFKIIGYKYGGSEDSFLLPDLCGRGPMGADPNDPDFSTLGHADGSKVHKLNENEMPSHQHEVHIENNGQHNHSLGTYPGHFAGGGNAAEYWEGGLFEHRTGLDGGHGHAATCTAKGSGTPHNNLQPYLTVNFIIKY